MADRAATPSRFAVVAAGSESCLTAARPFGWPAWGPGIGLALALVAPALGLAGVQARLLGQPLIEALVLALLLGAIVRNLVSGALAQSLAPCAALAAVRRVGPRVAVAVVATRVFIAGFSLAAMRVVGPTG